MMPKTVMKFGGTSLGSADAMRRSAKHVLKEPRSKMVICSAVGGVTDLLLDAADKAKRDIEVTGALEVIRKRHQEIVGQLAVKVEDLPDFDRELERLVKGVSMLRELTPRVKDAIVSLGERISVRIFAALLRSLGQPAEAFDSWKLGFQTNDNYGCAEMNPDCYPKLKNAMSKLESGLVPVVTGFIGQSKDGEITTIGRGGSDLSAAIFGAAAQCEEIQIWTDVPGILRADPRIVPGAEIIAEISFEEAAELAYFGAKVLHPRTIEPARKDGIPVRVLGTFSVDPDSPDPISKQGTLIHDGADIELVRALALRQKVQSLHIQSSRMLEAPGFLSNVFGIFAKHKISVDVIATSEVSVSMTFDRDGEDLIAAMNEIHAFAQVEKISDRSILCLVGAGLRKDTTLLAKIFDILARNDVHLNVISQGASRINITLVMDASHAKTAMRSLHDALFS